MITCYYFSTISLFHLSLHCWEGPVSKHFTVGLHLLFTKHVRNTIRFGVNFNSVKHFLERKKEKRRQTIRILRKVKSH